MRRLALDAVWLCTEAVASPCLRNPVRLGIRFEEHGAHKMEPVEAHQSVDREPPPTEQDRLILPRPRIAGWLFLLAIGLVWSVIVNLGSVPDYTGSAWEKIMSDIESRGLRNNDPTAVYLLQADRWFHFFSAGGSVAVCLLFFAKSWYFPPIAIWLLPLQLVCLIGERYLLSFTNAAKTGSTTAFGNTLDADIFMATARCLIWIPYLLWSKRVRATFRDQMGSKRS